jgi:hypothetical protein
MGWGVIVRDIYKIICHVEISLLFSSISSPHLFSFSTSSPSLLSLLFLALPLRFMED